MIAPLIKRLGQTAFLAAMLLFPPQVGFGQWSFGGVYMGAFHSERLG